jgi:cyclic pyranopterin phosphate synthase
MGSSLPFKTFRQMSGNAAPADSALNHFDKHGNAVMVDVGEKSVTPRSAAAAGEIVMNDAAFNAIVTGTAKKGDVLGVARIAGIMAAKKTAHIIPLCHSLNFDACSVDFNINAGRNAVEARCEVSLSAKTGAEMEALTGVSAALLTIYDMCKAVDRAMVINNIRLLEKSGGKSGHYVS